MEFRYHINDLLPDLSWLAIIKKDYNVVEIYCGKKVVIFDNYFVAGVWDGTLEKGDFDTCQHSCCTGGKINIDSNIGGVKFSTPHHLQESIFSIRNDNVIFISNSLSFVLVASGHKIDPDYYGYQSDMSSILYGHNSEKLILASKLHHNHKVFYHRYCDIIITQSLDFKKITKRTNLHFDNYNDYIQKISLILHKISQNANSALRNHKYGMISTISRGYDAPYSSLLAYNAGCDEVYTFSNNINDDGSNIAKQIGFKYIYQLNAKEFINNTDLLETEALASGSSDTTFIAFENIIKNKIIFIGNRGDSIFEKMHKNVNDNLDFHYGNMLSQASLTAYENMLKNNSITISIPLIGADKWSEISKISNSDEMKPYSLNNNYDRPIPRRLLEEFGIDRQMFGQNKFGAGVSYNLDTLSRIKHKISKNSFKSLIEYKSKFKHSKIKNFAYSIKFYYINRNIYINYIFSKLKLPIRLKINDLRTGMISNPHSTLLLSWAIEIISKRYKNYNI